MSDNFYWYTAEPAGYQELNDLHPAQLAGSAVETREGDSVRVSVTLQNQGSSVALMSKLTLLNAADGTRALPAYYSDNYVSLLPGESRTIEIESPTNAIHGNPAIALRGWNVASTVISVSRK